MLQEIEYSGTVWALSHNDPEPLIEHSIKKLQDYGVNKDDIKIVDAPDHPEVGQVVVEIWPHELVVPGHCDLVPTQFQNIRFAATQFHFFFRISVIRL